MVPFAHETEFWMRLKVSDLFTWDYADSPLGLDHYAFISPCTLNEVNIGGFPSGIIPELQMLSIQDPDGKI